MRKHFCEEENFKRKGRSEDGVRKTTKAQILNFP